MNIHPKFVYVTYVRTTPEKLWQALIDPEFTRKYWSNTVQESTWEPGASWKIVTPSGMIADSGEVVEFDPPKRLVVTWENQFRPELKGEITRLTYELEPKSDCVKLTVIHEGGAPESKMVEAVSGGWPVILASLKSLLETGESLEATREWPEDDKCRR
jgi:uncharacterized protein YndB with AHSA1/START domain